MFPLFALALKAFIFFVMALGAAHTWCEHHQKLLAVRRLGVPEGFTMGDANVRHPLTLYEKRPYMLCAKCFVLFDLGRDGGGVRENYTR